MHFSTTNSRITWIDSGESLARSWRPEWVDKVAELVLRFEKVGNPDDRDLQRNFVPAMQSLPDHGYAIGRRIIERLLDRKGRMCITCIMQSRPLSVLMTLDGLWLSLGQSVLSEPCAHSDLRKRRLCWKAR